MINNFDVVISLPSIAINRFLVLILHAYSAGILSFYIKYLSAVTFFVTSCSLRGRILIAEWLVFFSHFELA